jgi:lysophospholipase L1-like esterase
MVGAIAQTAAVTVSNAGINGNNTEDLLKRLDKDVISKNPDLVVLMIGTNDMLNVRNMLSLEQYEANYQKLIGLIKKKAPVILMTIPPVNSEYILQRQNREIYAAASPSEKVDAANAIIRRLAKKNKCKLIDLYEILQACGGSSIDKNSLFQNEANWNINDGVHPTVEGYRVIGTAVFQAVNYLFPDCSGIVCFGDSITFGYKMTGQGTVNGDSYPAVLNRMINHPKY